MKRRKPFGVGQASEKQTPWGHDLQLSAPAGVAAAMSVIRVARLGVALALGLGLVGATANLDRRTRRLPGDPKSTTQTVSSSPPHRS